jgi:hypothetical protein
MVVVAVAGCISWLYASVLAIENPALRNGALGGVTTRLILGGLALMFYFWGRGRLGDTGGDLVTLYASRSLQNSYDEIRPSSRSGRCGSRRPPPPTASTTSTAT